MYIRFLLFSLSCSLFLCGVWCGVEMKKAETRIHSDIRARYQWGEVSAARCIPVCEYTRVREFTRIERKYRAAWCVRKKRLRQASRMRKDSVSRTNADVALIFRPLLRQLPSGGCREIGIRCVELPHGGVS